MTVLQRHSGAYGQHKLEVTKLWVEGGGSGCGRGWGKNGRVTVIKRHEILKGLIKIFLKL